jgi:signal transduction histidine kinase
MSRPAASKAIGSGKAVRARRLPSISDRLARALAAWSLVWSVAVASAIWLAIRSELDELLDDTLQTSAELLASQLAGAATDAPRGPPDPVPESISGAKGHFAWQVVGADSQLVLRSALAPARPLHPSLGTGFSNTPQWRVFGMPLGGAGRILYVAQTREERREAQAEVAIDAALAALALGLLGHAWLRARLARELAPLQGLADRLADHEPLEAAATLGPAEREELEPVHAAIDALGSRLARRVAHERAFTAHAAHSLRTPLAGIDAQLAVALREAPPELRSRLQRVREAAGRLQRVVAALLAMFRSGVELQRRQVDVAALLERLPVEGLSVEVEVGCVLDADPDLLAAALLNLLDNAVRYGAKRIVATLPRAQTLRLHDDGPGVAGARRRELQAALDAQVGQPGIGLGLMLADLVARAHGGAVALPEVPTGFAVELKLG